MDAHDKIRSMRVVVFNNLRLSIKENYLPPSRADGAEMICSHDIAEALLAAAFK